jgi:hypothetical protein
MKYKDLIQFEPITSVVKLTNAGEQSEAERLVKTFVFSKKIKEDLEAVVINNLSPNTQGETKGIQIVGSYGTGKSHIMSLVSVIAENAELVNLLSNDEIKASFAKIAGQYKVLRFEVGTDKPLKDIVFAQVERFLSESGVEFTFDEQSNFSWKEQIQRMMSEFESSFPDKYFLVVIDELLEYLQGRKPTELNNDLMLLRQLGEACDHSRFKIMFGVQELLYRSPTLQYAADMLNKVKDRYDDLIITKEDVSFVVKERLLKKDIHQKQQIRDHLVKFSHLFEGINNNLNEYVDLFPVHPTYVTYFERIKHGKSQREILKILSVKFTELLEVEVPEKNPGLITFDSYWKELASSPSMLAIPDIRTVRDKMETVTEKINGFFIDARASRKGLATKIASGLAVSILCDDLDKRNGANPNSLKEDLCETIPHADDAEFLLAAIDSTAKQLVTATSGQYIDQDPTSGEFYIRTEGGINIAQLVKEYADEVIKRDPEKADEYYYDFLQTVLEYQDNTYRTGFKIWQDELEWIDKKHFRRGYVFFGNPDQRSTTEPIQQYYLFFCPIFSSIKQNREADEVYFEMKELSQEFKDTICLFGAAKAKEVSAPSNQKQLFKGQVDEYFQKARRLFDKEYAEKTKVIYGDEVKPLKSFSLLGEGFTKEMIFKNVAARILNKHFNEKFPDFPAFTNLILPNSDRPRYDTKGNFEGRIKDSLKKIVNQAQPNRDGEAILSGLGLWNGTSIEVQNSKYADRILLKLREKGDGKVLNRDEILKPLPPQNNLWYSVDFGFVDHQLMFVALAALAFKGDIEVVWSGNQTVSATNIEKIQVLQPEDYFNFGSIRAPQGIPVKNLKALFAVLGLPDLTSELDKPDTITKIITEARSRAEKVAITRTTVANGVKCRNIPLLSDEQSQKLKDELQVLATILDGIQGYNTYGRLKAFKYSEDELNSAFAAYQYCKTITDLKLRADKFEKLVGYLNGAKSYLPETDALFEEIAKTIEKLPDALATDDTNEIKQYEARLNDLINRYAEYYISQYTKYRLNAVDGAKRDGLLNSDKKRIADIVKDSEFANPAAPYQKWIDNVTSLRESDPSLTKAKVKEEPYHEFNPRDYQNKPVFSVAQLETELNEILNGWESSLRSVLKDPTIQSNLEILNSGDRKLIEDFSSSTVNLTKENAARLRDLIRQLAEGIDKVEISLDDLRQKLHRPMTPNEAIESLTQFVEDSIAGRERNKIRILIK